MPDLWTDLLGCLDLHIEDGERSGTHNVTVFEGASQQLKYHRRRRIGRHMTGRKSSPWRKSVRISHKTGESENHILVEGEL